MFTSKAYFQYNKKNLMQEKNEIPANCMPITRRGHGREGRKIPLLTNFFQVMVNVVNAIFYQYSVYITSPGEQAVEGKGIGRKVMDKLYQTYSSEMQCKQFAYDGEKVLYTVGPLPRNKFEFTVVLDKSAAKRNGSSGSSRNPSESDQKRAKRILYSKTFHVTISFATKVTMTPDTLVGPDAEKTADVLKILDTILRQQAAKRGCLLVRQSFFNDDVRHLVDIGGGVSSCRGFHSSFRATEHGLSLNMDVSSTMILTPGPVLDFLLKNQNIRDPRNIQWEKAKRMLKNLIIKTIHNGMEFKIKGISDDTCAQQLFRLKDRNGDGEQDITVYNYFTGMHHIELSSSKHMPCINVGRPKKPIYIPVELCFLVPLQRYTKSLSPLQRSSLVEKSRQKPQEKIRSIMDATTKYRYGDDSMLKACGISIEKKLTALDGRVLSPPTLKAGHNEDIVPRNGRWSFNRKRFYRPAEVKLWAIVNFSSRCNINHLARELVSVARSKGMLINDPFTVIEEDPQWRRLEPVARVDKMYRNLKPRLPGPPKFLLCLLPERKNCNLYGPWKKRNLYLEGITTQCLCPSKVNEQYLTNVLLKLNAKLGGTNSLLPVEHISSLPFIRKNPIMVLGMDVSHGSPGQSDTPSIAAVVGSLYWPEISRYMAVVRTQSPKVEMIESLYQPLADGRDSGIMRELLNQFYLTSDHHKPTQIIIFRDGVGESQFNLVLNIELEQIKKAYENLDGGGPLPKFTVIVGQKNHHTRFFHASGPDNVPAGTVVDTKVVHPRNYDFYMCAHNGAIGTSCPAHYHVLYDEIDYSADDLQKLVHSMSYVYQRSSTAISIVAPIQYAHLAAAQIGQCMKSDHLSDTSSSDGVTRAGGVPTPEILSLHSEVQNSMFFC